MTESCRGWCGHSTAKNTPVLKKIAAMIWQDYAIAIPEEEMMYLTVYIRRIYPTR